MILWLTAGAVIITWGVLRDPVVDHRVAAGGALVPLGIDVWFGRWAIGHTLLAAAVALVVVMVATIGRRKLRRRLVFVPFGMLCGLVLSGAWTEPEVFLWPARGLAFGDVALWPSLPLLVAAELVGLAGWIWIWWRFGLCDPARRRSFVRTGRLYERTPAR